jgi:V/A-type H+-transporting ATPase subunit I
VIIAMKKATVITRRPEKQEALHKLRKLGILHLSAIPAQVASAQEWREKKVLLEKALALITPPPTPSTGTFQADGLEAALQTARSVLEKQEAVRVLNEEQENLAKETACGPSGTKAMRSGFSRSHPGSWP